MHMTVVLIRQMVRQMSNCHKYLRFVIYCAVYGNERLTSLVFYQFSLTNVWSPINNVSLEFEIWATAEKVKFL